MTDPSLLPASATRAERSLSRAMALDARLPQVAAITGAKALPIEVFIPWLLWEYGLGEVLDYLTDPRRALREGVLWQRLRGTPAGLRTALSWRGWQDVTIEEGPSGSRHFAEFQLDPGVVLGDRDVDDLVGLSRLSAPARSRLYRIFHGYDLRRLRLDAGRLDHALLSDVSGIFDPRGLRLSFGRRLTEEAARQAVDAPMGVETLHATWVVVRNAFTLDASRQDRDRTLRIPILQHSRLSTKANAAGVPDQPDLRPRHFARAMVVLSDGRPLDGDINVRLSPRRCSQHGIGLRLSAGAARLSGYRSHTVCEPVNEVLGRRHDIAATLPDDPHVESLRHSRHPVAHHPTRRFPILSHPGWYRVPAHLVSGAVLGGSADRSGQFWTGTAWPAASWRDLGEVVAATHSTTTT